MEQKLGIALGGGGAKGLAHIGILEVLEEAGISVDVVAGTSIGALVGVVYCSGKLTQLKSRLLDLKLAELPILLSPTWSKGGLFSAKNAFEELFSEFLSGETFEQLTKPFAAVSTNLTTGAPHTFSSGDLRSAVRSSMSIPALFTPVVINGEIFVDGGTVDPVPVEAAISLGATQVIAVDLFGNREKGTISGGAELSLGPIGSAVSYFRSLGSKFFGGVESENLPNMLEILIDTFAISQKNITALRLKAAPPLFTISPPVSEVNMLDFHRAEPVIQLGRESAERALPQLKLALGMS